MCKLILSTLNTLTAERIHVYVQLYPCIPFSKCALHAAHVLRILATTDVFHLHTAVNVNVSEDIFVNPEKQSYMLAFLVLSTGTAKVLIWQETELGGSLLTVSCTPFSRRRIVAPMFVPSVQVMVRLFPSTTVTAPTGSMVTV